MRLFAALPLSDEAIARLLSFQLRWSAPRDGLRWSTPEQWHLTLQFFGEVDAETVSCLQDSLRPAGKRTPEVEIDRLDLFTAKGILIANVVEEESLASLHHEVLAAAARCGLRPDSKPFRPHITLARAKGKVGHKALQKLSQPALPSLGSPLRWHPAQLHLLQSTLRPGGAEYQLVHAFALDPAESACPRGAPEVS